MADLARNEREWRKYSEGNGGGKEEASDEVSCEQKESAASSAKLFLHSQALCCNRLLKWNIFSLYDPVTLGVAEYIL